MTTPEELGFVKPNGTDFINTGDDDISTNADASAAMYDALKLDASNKYPLKDHTHSKIVNTLGEITMDSAGGAQHSANGTRVWWVNEQGVLVEGTVPREALDRNPLGIENDFGTVLLDSAGGVQHLVNGTRVWWVNSQGVLIDGTVSKINNQLGTVLLDSAGGVQHQVSGTRVWWVNDKGVLAQGEIPWGRITGKPADSAGSGTKVVPLILSSGTGATADAPTSRHYRRRLRYSAPISRFRVHIRNWNPRLGTTRAGAINFTGLWLGKHAGNGAFASAPTQLRGGFATPADGSDWVSAWFPTPAGNLNDYLLSYGYSSTVAPMLLPGGSWNSASTADASAVAPAMSYGDTVPFEMVIEAETPSSTPVVGVAGDSLSIAIGSTDPVNDSPISQYARKINGLPYHLAASGESMNGMLTVNPGKMTRWEDLAKPDSITLAGGSNDVAEGISISALQERFLALMPVLLKLTSVIYLADIMPRNSWPVGSIYEVNRRQYNSWLRTQPAPARDVFAFGASISTDDETIIPAYDSGDGTHLNTAGYTKNMEAIVRPLTASPLRDTGVQDITALVVAGAISSGTITFQHKNGWNAITMSNVKLAKAGTVNLFPNNNVSLKPWAPGVDGISAGEVNENLALGSAGTDSRRLNLNYTGGMSVYGGVVDDVVNGTLIWPMNRKM